MDFFNWNFWMIGRYSPMRTGLGKIPRIGKLGCRAVCGVHYEKSAGSHRAGN